MHLYDVTDQVVVVVDIFRATSSIVTAFAHGVAYIKPVAHVQDCQTLQRQGYLAAGERDGVKVHGFDFGNSPFDYQQDIARGKSVALTTTNGTLAIKKAKAARKLIIGSFLNLGAVADLLMGQENDVLVVCAGWKEHINLEDSLFAGALLSRLRSHVRSDSDATLVVEALFHRAQPDLMAFLARSSHAQRLATLDNQRDVAFCLRQDQYRVVPELKGDHLVVPPYA